MNTTDTDIAEIHLQELIPEINYISVELQNLQFTAEKLWTPPNDMAALCAVIKAIDARQIFEIGTNLGLTTYQMAVNSSEFTQITTMDLPEDELAEHNRDGASNLCNDRRVRIGMHFLDTPYARRISLIRDSSLRYDFAPLSGSFDVVFIDGNHSVTGCASDTRNAFSMVRPGGAILWHDVDTFPGVRMVLNRLQGDYPVKKIFGTNLAILLR